MELRKILGNTWCLEADELIPLYKIDATHCILLDSGLEAERDALVEALHVAGLTPVGVFSSHAHRDHSANNFYLRSTCGTRVSLPRGEAALSRNVAQFRAAYDTFSPDTVLHEYGALLGDVDEEVAPQDGIVKFCGVNFKALHTPGHTPDHICTTTPDGVCYLADALLAGDFLQNAKIPYHYIHKQARQSMEKLRGTKAAFFVAAHRGIVEDLDALIDENLAHLDARCAALLALATREMTQDELCAALCRDCAALTKNPVKAGLYARNVRAMTEYLLDTGRLAMTTKDGMRRYSTR